MYRFVCDLFGADEGGVGGDLRLDLRVGQPRRVALNDGVLLPKFGIDSASKVLPDSGIGPIRRVVDPPTSAGIDPFDQPTNSGADHGMDEEVAFIDAVPMLRLHASNGGGRHLDGQRGSVAVSRAGLGGPW